MITESTVRERLEDAGRTIMMLPGGYAPAKIRSCWPEFQREFGDRIGASKENRPTRLRPTAEQMDNMDEVMTWIPMLKNINHRNAVRLRMLQNPYNSRPKYKWRTLGKMLDCSHETARTRYAEGILHITRKLNDRCRIKTVSANSPDNP